MHNTLASPPFRPSEPEGKSTFNVVIAYEDFETGKQAKKTYDFLTEQLGEEFQFNNQMWKFDVLAVPKLRAMAAKDATLADIIIVSAHGHGDLPVEVKSWVEMALADGIQAIGLVGLFDDSEFQDNPARTYLASVAQTANIEFFSQPGQWPSDESAPPPNWEGGSKTFSVLAGISDPSKNISHWGINE
jgi:hypothetical protein